MQNTINVSDKSIQRSHKGILDHSIQEDQKPVEHADVSIQHSAIINID